MATEQHPKQPPAGGSGATEQHPKQPVTDATNAPFAPMTAGSTAAVGSGSGSSAFSTARPLANATTFGASDTPRWDRFDSDPDAPEKPEPAPEPSPAAVAMQAQATEAMAKAVMLQKLADMSPVSGGPVVLHEGTRHVDDMMRVTGTVDGKQTRADIPAGIYNATEPGEQRYNLIYRALVDGETFV